MGLSNKTESGRWKPVSLTIPFLFIVIVLPLGLVPIILLLLFQSQRDGGVVFFKELEDVPISTQFLFSYLPTTIAVIYGLLWAWIDLDIRRLEPYFQLSKNAGAIGKQSLLLHYPVDILASVPIKALKLGHLSVFAASLATVLVFWGITPTQAGIFAVDDVLVTKQINFTTSSGLLSAEQRGNLSVQSAYSVMAIMWLNETLQPFMTRDYMLAPFRSTSSGIGNSQNETWIGVTQLYSVNVTCEQPVYWNKSEDALVANSSWGCSYNMPPPNPTVSNSNGKNINMVYVGWDNNEGSADYYLSRGGCPKNESRTFLAQVAKALVPVEAWNLMSPAEQRRNSDLTALWCRSSYFAQDVKATVSVPSMSVVRYEAVGPPKSIPDDIFNATAFEAAMSNGRGSSVRMDFPTVSWPDQTSFLLDMPLNTEYLPKMAPFAVGATQLPMESYLEDTTLENAYQAAYRLLFSRHMAEVFSEAESQPNSILGEQQFVSRAFVVVPAFAYTVCAFLLFTAVISGGILWSSLTRRLDLKSDPGTISELMSLIADDYRLIAEFKDLDMSSSDQLRRLLSDRQYKLVVDGDRSSLRLLIDEYHATTANDAPDDQQAYHAKSYDAVRPIELRMPAGVAFMIVQLAMFIVLAIFYVLVRRNNGLALPSTNRFVRQLLENYLPTALGVLFEPFWLVLNRHLCLLLPFDALRKGQQTAKASIDLQYNSLPPQLVLWKAFKNKHFLLGFVCSMTLLGNLLSIALSGLFNESVVNMRTPADFEEDHALQFLPMNGSGAPFTANKGGTLEPFYIALSNLSARTPLPPWTDENRFYLPLSSMPVSTDIDSTFQVKRPYLSTSLQCSPINMANTFLTVGTFKGNEVSYVESYSNLTLDIQREDGKTVTCGQRVDRYAWRFAGQTRGKSAFEFSTGLDGVAGLTSEQDAAFCREYVAAGWARSDVGHIDQLAVRETEYNITSVQGTAILCRPMLTTGEATIELDPTGHILKTMAINKTAPASPAMFSTSISDLLGQAHQYLFDSTRRWHNDSLPSDFNNYFFAQLLNDSSFLDASRPAPIPEEMIEPFSKLYTQTFATLIGRNYDRLLARTANDVLVSGFVVRSETRVFMSPIMFVLAETILGLYLVVTVAFYLGRPWKILARMPDSPASVIAFFAASHALQDLRGTSNLSTRGLANHLAELDRRYGFGTFMGTDGKVHTGIERHPLLSTYKREATLLTLSSGEVEKAPRTAALRAFLHRLGMKLRFNMPRT